MQFSNQNYLLLLQRIQVWFLEHTRRLSTTCNPASGNSIYHPPASIGTYTCEHNTPPQYSYTQNWLIKYIWWDKKNLLGWSWVLEELVQFVKCLLCKHEDISLIPRTHFEKLSMVAQVCKPSDREAEAGRSLGLTGQTAQPNWRASKPMKEPVWCYLGNDTQAFDLWLTCTYMHEHVHTHEHVHAHTHTHTQMSILYLQPQNDLGAHVAWRL